MAKLQCIATAEPSWRPWCPHHPAERALQERTHAHLRRHHLLLQGDAHGMYHIVQRYVSHHIYLIMSYSTVSHVTRHDCGMYHIKLIVRNASGVSHHAYMACITSCSWFVSQHAHGAYQIMLMVHFTSWSKHSPHHAHRMYNGTYSTKKVVLFVLWHHANTTYHINTTVCIAAWSR
jgi:hypothetical protein